MAFSGVHISYGPVHDLGSSGVFWGPIWSETMLSSGTTTNSAIQKNSVRNTFMVQPSVDVFVAIGPNPNASASPRSLVLAGERVLIPCTYGDKLAWVAA